MQANSGPAWVTELDEARPIRVCIEHILLHSVTHACICVVCGVLYVFMCGMSMCMVCSYSCGGFMWCVFMCGVCSCGVCSCVVCVHVWCVFMCGVFTHVWCVFMCGVFMCSVC